MGIQALLNWGLKISQPQDVKLCVKGGDPGVEQGDKRHNLDKTVRIIKNLIQISQSRGLQPKTDCNKIAAPYCVCTKTAQCSPEPILLT